jgi:hypothetical protein
MNSKALITIKKSNVFCPTSHFLHSPEHLN